MDIKAEILREHSKQQASKIANHIGHNKKRFAELMTIFLGDDKLLTQRSAWVVSHCIDIEHSLIIPYIEQVLKLLHKDTAVVIKRNVVRVLQFVEIPNHLLDLAAEKCFSMMESKEESIAVKVFSMTILGNICEKVPELAHELSLIIEDQMPYGSAGFKSRGSKTLMKLKKLKPN